MVMNKKTIRLLNDLQKLTERTAEVIADLKKVDWNELLKEIEKPTEEDIGKLCWFSDHEDFAGKRVGIYKGFVRESKYPYETETGAIYKYCKRLSEEELEEMS